MTPTLRKQSTVSKRSSRRGRLSTIKQRQARTSRSKLELQLKLQLENSKVPPFVEEHRFHETRRWKFDFAWPEFMLAVEVEGGVYNGGRHVTGAGFEKDCVKYNEAGLLGWTVLRGTSKHVRTGILCGWIHRFLRLDSAPETRVIARVEQKKIELVALG